MIHLLTSDRRVTVETPPADLMGSLDQRSEALRLAAFAYSSGFLTGGRADFQYPFAGYATEAEYLGSPPDPYPETP